MKYLFLILLLACSSQQATREPQSVIKQGPFPTFEVYNEKLHTNFRVGAYLENRDKTFKGCIIYLQGLADSFLNHEPLFKRLSDAGYRTISFDYLGQGGSGGTMNDTRIISPFSKEQEIGQQARWVWEMFSTDKFKIFNRSCSGSKKRVIGWSTGGLAGYRLAYEKWAQEVALIAPGLHVRTMIGEAATDWSKMFLFKDTITLRTLTRNTFNGMKDPHVDPIKPSTPAVLPHFATNLVTSSMKARKWSMPRSVKGIVFISGLEDTYIDRENLHKTIAKNAPHFVVRKYNGALHELDNELPEVSKDLHERTVKFFGE